MNRDDFYAELAKFFRDQFEDDPIGVGDWLAQGGTDVEAFLAELDRIHPADSSQAPSGG